MKNELYLSTAYLDDLMVRMAHHSTAIEGNSLTQGETKSVLIDGYVPRAIDLRELNEVLNYKTFTKEMVRFLQEGREVNGEFIKEIHAVLCREAIESVPGKFKTQPNMVIGADFTPSPPYSMILPTPPFTVMRRSTSKITSLADTHGCSLQVRLILVIFGIGM